MRAPIRFRRQPTALERLIGRRRARMLRRRVGLVALGFGVSLVKPRRTTTWSTAAATMAVVAAATLFTFH